MYNNLLDCEVRAFLEVLLKENMIEFLVKDDSTVGDV